MQIQYLLELSGTGLFAMSGAIAANQKAKPDWFGVTFIGFITAIGGGSIRDILLGAYPLPWVADETRIYVIVAAIVCSSLFFNVLLRLRKTIFLFDSLGVALFTILGTEKAMAFHVSPLIAAVMGMFSAIMGGVLRDVLINEIPMIFRKEIYATTCLTGSMLYILLKYLNYNRNLCLLVSVAVIFTIRILAVKYKLSLPQFRKDTSVETTESN